jgi:hypothetical protein
MSYREENGQVVLTDWMVEPMAEVLLYRMTLLPLGLTGRQKALGQALFRFMASRNDVWQLPAKHVIDYSGNGKPNETDTCVNAESREPSMSEPTEGTEPR